MKKALLALLLLIPFSSVSAQWDQLPGIPAYRESAQYAWLDGRIYLFGGYGPGAATHHKNVMMLDIGSSSASWQALNDMPSARTLGYAAVYNGKIYIIGGVEISGLNQGDAYKYNKTVLEYDPSNDTYTEKASMPIFSSSSLYAQLGDRIFIIGGKTSDSVSVRGTKTTATVQMYDITQDRWTRLNDAPYIVEMGTADGVNGRIIVAGGASSSGFVSHTYSGELSGDSIVWTKKADMPFPVGYAAAGTLDGKFYVAGGLTPTSQSPLNKILMYDPAQDTWSSNSMPFSDYHMPRMVNDISSLYYISGNKKTTVYKYSPLLSGIDEGNALPVTALLSPNPSNNTHAIRLSSTKKGLIGITLYSPAGEKINELVNGFFDAGEYVFHSDASALAEGLYYYRIYVDGNTSVQSLSVIR